MGVGMKPRRSQLINTLVKLEMLTTGIIMLLTFLSLVSDPQLGDPISGTLRTSFTFLSAVGFSAAIIGLFSKRRATRFWALASGGIVVLLLGTAYAFLLPAQLNVWFVITLGASLISSAGVVYFLPSNLKNLTDLNQTLSELEAEVDKIRDLI